MKVPLDFLSVLGAFLIAYFFRSRPELIPSVILEKPFMLPFSNYLWFSIQAAALVVLIFALERLYSLKKSYRFRKEIRRMIMFTGAAFTIIILYFFLVGITFFSRFILGVSFIIGIAFMVFHRLLLRFIQHFLWRRGIGRRRILFIGEGKIFQELSKRWQHSLGFELVGRLVEQERTISKGEIDIVGTYENLEEVVRHYDVEEVVQVAHIKNSAAFVEFCQLNHIEYRFVPNLLEVQRTNTEIDFVGEIPIITLRPSAIDGWARVVKRVMDIVFSSLGLILFSPIFLLIAIGIKFDDGGPIFYRSRRTSRNKSFLMWKFRSMLVEADQKKKELAAENRRAGPLFKIENDPRITRFGRFLRKTTLDELPQLWNVFKGDLSLVGPRAHLPEEIEQYEKRHRKVLAVKAGATGLAQVSGRSKLSFEEEVKLDVYYLENWSLMLDIKIILKTFTVLIEGE